MLKEKIELAIKKLEELPNELPIRIISHFDTDGIASGAIMARTLERLNKKFTLQTVKNLSKKLIEELPKNEFLIFLDIGSNFLSYLKDLDNQILIFDHQEIIQELPLNVTMINPLLEKQDPLSSAGICYSFSKTISKTNLDLANLAVLGMVGEGMEKNLSKEYEEILKDAETKIKKSLLIYPATRSLDKALEYSSNPYIRGVSGNYKGTIELLKEANISKIEGKYKSLYELNDEEMSGLLTAVMLRCDDQNQESLIGNLYLVKFFNKQEDAREISARINACSKMNSPIAALGFCLGNINSKQESEKIHISYKQHLISALKNINEMDKISGKEYEIINTQDKVKDTIIGTVMSIVSNSPIYERGSIIIGLAYNQDKIKVSARIAGRTGDRNVREILNTVIRPFGGEAGGHSMSAGCVISKTQETPFIEALQKSLEAQKINA
jgi:single-stranded-DNA-specific exonuclease